MDKQDVSVERLLLAILMLAATFAASVQVRATVLPNSCGSDNVKFKVNNKKDQPPPAAPAADKAQIIIVEAPDIERGCFGPACDVTVRIGMDGTWMGASQGKSYFAFSVTPGEHHLCVDWQSVFGSLDKKVAMTSLTAEAGNIYYYQVKPVMLHINDPDEIDKLHMKPLSEDEGMYGVKISALSTSTAKR